MTEYFKSEVCLQCFCSCQKGRVFNWCLSVVSEAPTVTRLSGGAHQVKHYQLYRFLGHLIPIFGESHPKESVCIGLMRQGKFNLVILKGVYRTFEYNIIKNTS